MHRGGDTRLSGLDWAGQTVTASYSTSKLHVTALPAAIARLFPHLLSNAVNPGWVPTRMGGPWTLMGGPSTLMICGLATALRSGWQRAAIRPR